MSQNTINISGRVLGGAKLRGVAGLRVEAQSDGAKAKSLTDQQGAFTITFDQARHPDLFKDNSPEIIFTFNVFAGETLISTTQEAVPRNGMDGKFELDIVLGTPDANGTLVVKGTIRTADGEPLASAIARAFDLDLRREENLGEGITDQVGRYEIRYSPTQFRRSEKGSADLVVKAFAADGSALAASPVLFNAPQSAEIDLIIPETALQPPSEFEKTEQAIAPLLEKLTIVELEENQNFQDISFLAGETGIAADRIARFALAHRLMAASRIKPPFWYALLAVPFYQTEDNQSLDERLQVILNALQSLDAAAVENALTNAFSQNLIPSSTKGKVAAWTEAFLAFVAKRAVNDEGASVLKGVLEDAGIEDTGKQERFARLLQQHHGLTPDLLEVLKKDESFDAVEIADIETTFSIAELAQGNFSVAKVLKKTQGIRQPDKVRLLAKTSEEDWIKLVRDNIASGDLELPVDLTPPGLPAEVEVRPAEVYGKMLAQQFREAFPTTAFLGGLERSMRNGGAKGLKRPELLSRFLEENEDFEFLTTTVDEFLENKPGSKLRVSAQDDDFRLELKAVQRAFKLEPNFEASNTLLSDDLHSAQQIYRMGESKFVHEYGNRPGFTVETAQRAYNSAAETYAAVLTLVGELKSLEANGLPAVLDNGNKAISTFPNWNNLFKTGDLCECEHCRSVYSPAAYFADLLMFLKEREAKDQTLSVKDILFKRRPDLGYLELNCENANTPLPYIDIVCEVLEDVIANGENDLSLPALTNIPDGSATTKTAVAQALALQGVSLGTDFTLSQVGSSDRWVAHGDAVTYLLKKKGTVNYFAEILRNTKASAAELRANPQYVNPKAYDKLKEATYPFALPFDLFNEEVRAAFQKVAVKRWELMETFRGDPAQTNQPNNASEGDVAAEYFGISVDSNASTDERRIILNQNANDQHQFWGEPDNTSMIDNVSGVDIFLQRTGLEYNQLLALLDLEFIKSNSDIHIVHLDPSCDTAQKRIETLDADSLDRIHRFLRLYRKLKGWNLKMWELDLVIRQANIGNGDLDEHFLINLMHFFKVKNLLGGKVTVEQVCSLFGNLNFETHFSRLHEKREDALYQNLFLNKRLIHPLDPVFQIVEIASGVFDVASGQSLTDHLPVIQAALGIREPDLLILISLWRDSDASRFSSADLSLESLSFLYRHALLAKTLKFKMQEWVTLLKLTGQSTAAFADPQSAWEFLERISWLKNSGFTPDELNWLLSADRSAKAAVKENDAAKFLFGLRKELQAIRDRYDPSQYDFLQPNPPDDEERLAVLLTTLLQKLNRDDAGVKFFLDTVRGEVAAERIVAGLPPDFTFPEDVEDIPISYNKLTETLRFTSVMKEAQKTTLKTHASLAAVTVISDYQAAIDDLFDQLDQARLAVKFYEPIFTVPLEVLPATVDFKSQLPTEFAARISYDAEQRVLRFTGIMSADEKAQVEGLSPDASYLAAVSSLADQPRTITAPDDRIWLLDADLDSSVDVPDVDSTEDSSTLRKVKVTVAQRMANAIRKALDYLSKTDAENAVVQQSSNKLGLTPAIVRILLTDLRIDLLDPDNILEFFTGDFSTESGAIDAATFPVAFDTWYWLNRVAAILKKWKISLEEFEILLKIGAAAQLLDFESLPANVSEQTASLNNFLRTALLLKLRDTLPETGITLLEVLEKLHGGSYTREEFAADVQRVNEDWNASDALKLTESLDLMYPNDYLLAESWERLRKAFRFLEKLNAGTDVAKTFASPTVGKTESDALKQLLRSRFGAETWLTISTEIQDVLRERKAGSLVAWLLYQFQPPDPPSQKWENTNDVYAYYLIDVEMSACQLTSRFVNGSGSVQLFGQRCFMGLEPDVVVKAGGDDGDSAWRWWQWMKKYRVWEANRKVYLYAENWIEPELRRDKSEFFEDLENELRQNEINEHSVETAFLNYLDKLDGVAHLEIAGFYQEDDGDRTILHVFGRTKGGEPHIYYYRRFDYRQWTPWKKVNLDITGDYLIPAVINNQVFLFWPIFTEASDEQANKKVKTPVANADTDIPVTTKRLQLRMAMSRYRQGKWTPKKVSKDAYETLFGHKKEIIRNHYRFWAIDRTELDGRFFIRFEGHSDPKYPGPEKEFWAGVSGCFEVGGCDGGLELCDLPGQFQHVLIPDRIEKFVRLQKWVESQSLPRNEFTLIDKSLVKTTNQPPSRAGAAGPIPITPILIQTPNIFKVTPPWHLSLMDKVWLDTLETKEGVIRLAGSWLSLFYADRKRTFFVLPSLKREGVRDYYPDIKKSFRKAQNLFENSVQASLDKLHISEMREDQRKELEKFLHSQFPDDEEQPPYTDAHFLALMKRHMMRRFNEELGNLSLRLFQSRQYHFKTDYHPFVCDFVKLASNPLKGIPAMMSRETQLKDSGFSFKNVYQPTFWVVEQPTEDFYPVEDVDFTTDGAYSPYNWELFFHAPLMIANSLSKNQRFEEAMQWYHFIFNPIGAESDTPGGSSISNYWITKPFYQTTDQQYVQQRIDNILRLLANDQTVPGFSGQLKRELEDQVRDWRDNPFDPHRLAQYRTVIYQKTTVMKYLDNLIAWGDFLFRQDSIESINEAAQLYVLAAEILGPRPKKIPPQARPPLESFNEMEDQLDSFSNALVQMENLVPVMPGNTISDGNMPPLPMLYFCIPQNEKLLGYWDTVADRLFKIRHCMNIEGVVRQLALFEPPIDPGLLVKAVAGGVDIGIALSDLSAPLPLYRFNMVLQKANEVCNDVKALGGALLSALEKRDAEELSLLRQGHEIKLLEAVKGVREKQIEEAKESLEGLKKSKILIETRRDYYRDIIKILPGEQLSLDKQKTAFDHQKRAQQINIAASILGFLPSLTIGASGFGGSPLATAQWGVGNIISALQAAAGSETQLSNAASFEANTASTLAGYDRRSDDWNLQQRLADKELAQMENQIAAAELRIAIAGKELDNQNLQIENSRATDELMRSKYTNEELYQWQVGEISGVYFQSYRLAYELAKQAERCFRFELGLQDSSYINFGYWDSLKKGLLSGDKLQYDLRRLEAAHMERNRREFELTKNMSLTLLDPLALVQLRETGRCFFRLPEEIFDLDWAGHYFRRIKSVSLSVPCVVGPYTTISCTLRLLNNSTRVNTTSGTRVNTTSGDNGYSRNTDQEGLPIDDDRFIENNIPVKAMAASSAQNDSGVFELNFRDERYLPFEGAGVISEWSLELFSDLPSNNPNQDIPDFGKPLRQFDYDTISDAILHVKYTAREDAGPFKNSAVEHLRKYFSEGATTPSLRLFDLRREFPTQWHRFLTSTDPTKKNTLELEMSSSLFPFRDEGKTLIVNSIWLLARCKHSEDYTVTILNPPLLVSLPDDTDTMILHASPLYGGLHVDQKDVSESGIEIAQTGSPWVFKVTAPGGVDLQEDSVKVEDMLLVLEYHW